MKAKIRGKLYDSEVEPILIILEDGDHGEYRELFAKEGNTIKRLFCPKNMLSEETELCLDVENMQAEEL